MFLLLVVEALLRIIVRANEMRVIKGFKVGNIWYLDISPLKYEGAREREGDLEDALSSVEEMVKPLCRPNKVGRVKELLEFLGD